MAEEAGDIDAGAFADAFAAWFAARHPSATAVNAIAQPVVGGGYSSDVVLVEVGWTRNGGPQRGAGGHDELVVRMRPAGPTLFRDYDLGMQSALQDAVHAAGGLAPAPTTYEPDPVWLGRPFLVMPRARGHIPGQFTAADPWILGLEPRGRIRLADGFLDVLAAIHRTPWRSSPLASLLRGGDAALADELRWWEDLADAMFAGEVPPRLVELLAWCREQRPAVEPPAVVLWGDARLGNVVFDDDAAPVAVLDWEMASIGPPEMDLAWFTALEAMAEHFSGMHAPDLPRREDLVAGFEARIGRSLVDFDWFEAFATCRAAMLSIRTDQLAAERAGREHAPADDHVVLVHALDRALALDRSAPSTR